MSILPGTSNEVIDATSLRRGSAAFATGITVITVGGDDPHGMTANSFTSVSIDPPLVLVCIGRDAIMHRHLEEAGHFGVSVLAEHQEDVARHFANRWRPLGSAQFETVGWHPGPETGVPLITGALALFECEQWRAYDGGDHTIFLGKVLCLDKGDDEEALLFYGGRFHRLTTMGELTA
jgi:flavin reductase